MITSKKEKYKWGLALSGGGAKGFAHIGAIQVLEEKGIVPDIISGTSAGAVVGAFYAAGFSLSEIMKMFMKYEVRDFLSFTLPNKEFMKYNGFRDLKKTHSIPKYRGFGEKTVYYSCKL